MSKDATGECMTNKKLKTLLSELNACQETVEWVGDRNLATAWADCEHPVLLLWLAWMMTGEKGWPVRKEVSLAAIECGRLSLAHAGEYREQLSAVFDAAERCVNDPTPENIMSARSAEITAWGVARNAAWSARNAAWGDARSTANKTMCKIIRGRLSLPEGL